MKIRRPHEVFPIRDEGYKIASSTRALHALLVCLAVAVVFLQRYFELRFLAVHGYGVTTSVYTLGLYSAFIVLLDAWIVKGTLNSKRTEKILALVVPALFLFMGVFMILGSLDVELLPFH